MHTSDEGKLIPMSKARGRKASLQALIDKVAELGIEPSEQVMFICHADCEKESRAVAEELKARYTFTEENAEEILRREVGAVFATVLEHAGVYKCTPEGREAFMRFVQSV